VYTHQAIIWSPDNPYKCVTQPNFPARVTVWCGFTASFIIGPYFFEESVTSERYLQMLQNFVVPCLQQKNILSRITFQQDGAPPHIGNTVKTFLREKFQEEHLISRHFQHEWPPRSPDLAPPDYWLWGFLKGRVYSRQPTTIQELKNIIAEEVASITSEQLKKAVEHHRARLVACLEEAGGHFENYL